MSYIISTLIRDLAEELSTSGDIHIKVSLASPNYDVDLEIDNISFYDLEDDGRYVGININLSDQAIKALKEKLR